MAIIAFWSDERKETGQTLSMVALSTYMAIEHNYRILNVGTSFQDETLEDCYWNVQKEISMPKNVGIDDDNAVGIETGTEGLIKVIRSNRMSAGLVPDYSKVVFNNRLDVLSSPQTPDIKEYNSITKMYTEILNTANRDYDLVFVDISKRMEQQDIDRILEIADVIIVNITQRLKMIQKFSELRASNQFFKKNNILLNIGRYDAFSKYNVKNIARFLKMRRDVLAIPYNTLFFESCAEGRVAEYFLRLRNVELDDRNQKFVNQIANMCTELIGKLQELQVQT